jgi:carboxylesterase
MIMTGAEPFFFHGSEDVGVLLVHGYSGTPAELRELGERLHTDNNYTVLGILLPGHGTDPHDLERIKWQDWYLAVEAGVKMLKQTCRKVVVIGMSMGSLLTLMAASELELQWLLW